MNNSEVFEIIHWTRLHALKFEAQRDISLVFCVVFWHKFPAMIVD